MSKKRKLQPQLYKPLSYGYICVQIVNIHVHIQEQKMKKMVNLYNGAMWWHVVNRVRRWDLHRVHDDPWRKHYRKNWLFVKVIHLLIC